ncbi:hypothetical protein L9F63_012839 [Diploptera punctata]|uniref:Uncharacterized protein n=1 Tax=Diploptera punctata TaxID=6984 RepID=A0AAD8EMU2_DIPPU|nr:hypothetical protein L9F63_012839 [Diploptera punctata]
MEVAMLQEELQNEVFDNKRQFCEDVREFVDEFGLTAMMSQIEKDKANAEMKRKYEQLKVELQELDLQLAALSSQHEAAKLREASVVEERDRLMHQMQEINGRLEKMQEMIHNTELLEAECESVQRELAQGEIQLYATIIDYYVFIINLTFLN